MDFQNFGNNAFSSDFSTHFKITPDIPIDEDLKRTPIKGHIPLKIDNSLNQLDKSIPSRPILKYTLKKDDYITPTLPKTNPVLQQCIKILLSPLAIFFHIGRLAVKSFSTGFSFAVAFSISDLIFFYFLDAFYMQQVRYILLAVTGVVALLSLKGIVSSIGNIALSFVTGTYSWYFSIFNKDCSVIDFLFGNTNIKIPLVIPKKNTY